MGKEFKSIIHLGQFRLWRGRNGTCLTFFGLNSPKLTTWGQTGPQVIGASLAIGAKLGPNWGQIFSIWLSSFYSVGELEGKRTER